MSSAHIDNQPVGSRPPWVNCFVRDLATNLRMRLGTRDDLTIHFDGHGSIQGGRPLDRELVRSARAAAVFVAITSPAYVDPRSRGLDELRAFARTKQADRRIFPVELLPLDNESDYPPELQGLTRFKFWTFTNDRVAVPIPPKTEALFEKLSSLADQMRRHLKQMRDNRNAVTAWRQSGSARSAARNSHLLTGSRPSPAFRISKGMCSPATVHQIGNGRDVSTPSPD
jgi:hypothetical protein